MALILPRLSLASMQPGLALAFVTFLAPNDVPATVYGCRIDYPPEVEERYWAAISRHDLYPDGDELCTATAIAGNNLGRFNGTDPKALARRLMTDFGGLWRVTGNETLEPVAVVELPNGSSYWRFQERIGGRSVLNGGVIVETATAGGEILSIHARFLPDFKLDRDPVVAATDAVERVLGHRKAGGGSLPSLESIPEPRLSWYFTKDAPRLVWEVDVPETPAHDGPTRHMYLVDALDGSISADSNQDPEFAAVCDKANHQADAGVHRLGWSASEDAEFYELNCARDAEFVTPAETVYVGKLTEVIGTFVTDTWCRVRACKLEGCSVWVGSMHAPAWPVCNSGKQAPTIRCRAPEAPCDASPH